MTNDNMLSRQNFIVMTLIMCVVFFLFLATGAARELFNEYGKNDYAFQDRSGIMEENTYTPKTDLVNAKLVYVGNDDSIYFQCKEYARYFRQNIFRYNNLSEIDVPMLRPEMVIIEGKSLSDKDYKYINKLIQKRFNLVFVNLPSETVISESEKYRTLFGIEKIRHEDVEYEGAVLYDGLLLGGKADYVPYDDKAKKEQFDLDVTFPWYELGSGTKTYMAGQIPEDFGKVENEDLPALIWRNRSLGCSVYAVNGDFMKDETALGLLAAFAYESEDAAIYPVVNATAIIALDFPSAAAENEDEMEALYARNAISTERDLIWSGISSVLTTLNGPITCMVSPRINDASGAAVSEDALVDFLKLVKERQAECGVCLSDWNTGDDVKALAEDSYLYQRSAPDYRFQCAYIGNRDPLAAKKTLDSTGFSSVRTLLSSDSSDGIARYANEDTLSLTATNTADSHTYMENLRMRSIYTALGMSLTTAELGRIIYPDGKDDEWQNFYDRWGSYVYSYYRTLTAFDCLTLSQTAARARVYLNADYKAQRTLTGYNIDIASDYNGLSFLLRLHNQKIDEVVGADWVEVESGSYLVQAKNSKIVIRLKKKGSELVITE